jgi:hypothetical protein
MGEGHRIRAGLVTVADLGKRSRTTKMGDGKNPRLPCGEDCLL